MTEEAFPPDSLDCGNVGARSANGTLRRRCAGRQTVDFQTVSADALHYCMQQIVCIGHGMWQRHHFTIEVLADGSWTVGKWCGQRCKMQAFSGLLPGKAPSRCTSHKCTSSGLLYMDHWFCLQNALLVCTCEVACTKGAGKHALNLLACANCRLYDYTTSWS